MRVLEHEVQCLERDRCHLATIRCERCMSKSSDCQSAQRTRHDRLHAISVANAARRVHEFGGRPWLGFSRNIQERMGVLRRNEQQRARGTGGRAPSLLPFLQRPDRYA